MNGLSLSSSKEFFELPDCAALTENGGCSKLDTPHCLGRNCTFLNQSEETEAFDAWKRRLTALPEEQQHRISKKYYGGSMPWR